MAGKREKWSVSQEEEDEYRRSLFARAKKGEAKAQRELLETYGVRLYSKGEKAQLVYESPQPKRKQRAKTKGQASAVSIRSELATN
jgi:hypothetical protein